MKIIIILLITKQVNHERIVTNDLVYKIILLITIL